MEIVVDCSLFTFLWDNFWRLDELEMWGAIAEIAQILII